MQNVGGPMTYCKLVAAVPTVIAEMSFVERSGAEKVIEMFNGKKVSATIIVSITEARPLTDHLRLTVALCTSTSRLVPPHIPSRAEPAKKCKKRSRFRQSWMSSAMRRCRWMSTSMPRIALHRIEPVRCIAAETHATCDIPPVRQPITSVEGTTTASTTAEGTMVVAVVAWGEATVAGDIPRALGAGRAATGLSTAEALLFR